MEKGLAKIGKNDVCLCGSGKRYRRCCKGKGVRFTYLEFSGRTFAYNLDIVNAHLTRLSDFCHKNIITPFNQRSPVDRTAGLNLLRDFYVLLDNVLAPFLENSSCTKGCKECCILVVDTTPIGVDLIREYIEEHFDRDAKTALVSQPDSITITPKWYPQKKAPPLPREGEGGEKQLMKGGRTIKDYQ